VKVVIAGGTGTLGRRIAADLTARGDDVVILTRRLRPSEPFRQLVWDADWAGELAGAALINLAGELVDRPPTPTNIDLLTRSRVTPTNALAAAAAQHRPAVWLQASTLAIYGDAGETVLDEESPPADGPPQMAGVARAWEEAARGAPADRMVFLRMGVVFDRDTPALDRLTGITRWGLGGRIADGRQWVSWLHIADLLGVVRLLLDEPPAGTEPSAGIEPLAGVVHVTSPEPVRNAELMATLRRVLRRPPAPPTPAALVHLGARVLRTDPALALTGRRAVPRRLLAHGYRFRYPHLADALHHLLKR
jgi:uncharacterized protein